jgi:hypothetical protein
MVVVGGAMPLTAIFGVMSPRQDNGAMPLRGADGVKPLRGGGGAMPVVWNRRRWCDAIVIMENWCEANNIWSVKMRHDGGVTGAAKAS